MRLETNGVHTVIIEGVSLTGKTQLIRSVTAHPRYRQRHNLSTLILSEHYTQRHLESRPHVATADSLNTLQKGIQTVANLHTLLQDTSWEASGQLAHRMQVILERFHLTHVCSYPTVTWLDVELIDQALASLYAKLLIAYANERTIAVRLSQSSRNQMWTDYVNGTYGGERAFCTHLMRQQDQYLDLARKSRLPHTVIDLSEPSDTVVHLVLDHLHL